MLSDLPGGCHSTPRWGPHGSSQPCCLPPPRLPWAVAAGYPELVWSFCALAGQSFVCRPYQHPRSCLLQRGSCNQTRRPRSLRRGRPNDRHAVPRPPHRLPDPSSLLHTLRHGSELTGTLCPLPSDAPRSSVSVSNWQCANRTAPKEIWPAESRRERQPEEMPAGPVNGKERSRRPSGLNKAASRRGGGPADER